jgi:hypothetical protein
VYGNLRFAPDRTSQLWLNALLQELYPGTEVRNKLLLYCLHMVAEMELHNGTKR